MTDRRRLQVLFLLATLANSAQMGSRVAVPLAALELGATPFGVGALMAVFSIFPALLGIHAGRWMDRVGRRVPMLVATLLMAATLLLMWLLPALWAIFVTHAFFGLAVNVHNNAVMVACGTIGRPEDRTKNFSWISLTGAIASIIGPMTAGYLIDAIGNWKTFGALAIGPAICAAIIFASPGGVRPAAVVPASSGERPRVMDLLVNPRLTGLLVIGGLLGLSWDVFSFVVPVYGKSIGLSASEIGSILGAFGLAMLIVRAAMPVIVRAMKEWTIVVWSLAACAAAFLFFPFVRSSGLLFALTFVYGVGFGATQPVLNSLLFNASPAGRASEALGLRSTLQNGLHSFVPALFGIVASVLGMTPVFLSAAAILGAGAWMTRVRWSRG